MSDTTFFDKVTTVVSSWLNDVNRLVYDIKTSIGSSLVGHIASEAGATATTVQAALRESVSVKRFGAVGNGVTDDTAAIQLAVNSTPSVFFPAGTYLVSSMITMPLDNFSLAGVRGQSIIKATAGNAIFGPGFSYAAQYGEVQRLTFRSSTSGSGMAIYTPASPVPWYLSHWKISECSFEKSLAVGINANMIACVVDRCKFGLDGAGTAFQAIKSLGSVTPLYTSNINVISNCEFAYCTGTNYVVECSSGFKLILQHNIFEQNSPTIACLRINGINYPSISNNWFEHNTGTSTIRCDLVSGLDVIVLNIEECLFDVNVGPSTAIIDWGTTSNKNLRFLDNIVAGGSVPLQTAGYTIVEASGNYSTNSGYASQPTDKAIFNTGISTTGSVVAGLFTTFSATVSAGTVAVTLYTLPTLGQTAMYLVQASSYRNDATNYSAFAVISTDGSTARLIQNSVQAGITLTLAGLIVSVVTNSVPLIPVTVNVVRIA